jgi:hypothetical protein
MRSCPGRAPPFLRHEGAETEQNCVATKEEVERGGCEIQDPRSASVLQEDDQEKGPLRAALTEAKQCRGTRGEPGLLGRYLEDAVGGPGVLDERGPVLVPLERGRTAHHEHAGARARDADVHAAEVGHEADALLGVGAHAREDGHVLLPPLEAVDGVDVNQAGRLRAQRRLEPLARQHHLVLVPATHRTGNIHTRNRNNWQGPIESPADWKDRQSEGRLHVFQRTMAERKAIEGGSSIHSKGSCTSW